MKRSVFYRYGGIILLILFLLCFFIGLFFSSLTRESQIWDMTGLEPVYLGKIEHLSIDKGMLFFLTAGKRLRTFFLLWLLSHSVLNRPITLFSFAYWGISAGAVSELLIIKYGFKGILLYFGLVFPQTLFYMPGYLLLGNYCLKYLPPLTEKEKGGGRRKLECLLASFGLLLVGVISECWINPLLLKNIVPLILG
ncbi:MAG: stage II sporulation protein M [Lachnospiraceae bacterium]